MSLTHGLLKLVCKAYLCFSYNVRLLTIYFTWSLSFLMCMIRTVIPLWRLYLKGNLIQIQVSLCRGKALHDKKEAIKERDLNRQAQREAKDYRF